MVPIFGPPQLRHSECNSLMSNDNHVHAQRQNLTSSIAVTYPRRKVSGRAEVAAKHRQTERSEEENERQQKDVWNVGAVATVTLQSPVPLRAVTRIHAAITDEDLVLCCVAVVIHHGPVYAECPFEPGFEITSETFVPAVRLVADL